MLAELALQFVVFVAASYVGTTMALRGYFGRGPGGPATTEQSATTDCRRENSENEK